MGSMTETNVTYEELASLLRRCSALELQHETDQKRIKELTELAYSSEPDEIEDEDGQTWKEAYESAYKMYRSLSARVVTLQNEERARTRMISEMSQKIADLQISLEQLRGGS